MGKTVEACNNLDNEAPPDRGFEVWRPRGSDCRSICQWLNDVNTGARLAHLLTADTLTYAKLARCEVECHFFDPWPWTHLLQMIWTNFRNG